MQLFVTSKRESKELLCGQRWDDDNSHPLNQRPGPATSHKTEMFFCSCCLAVFCFFHVADGVSWSLTKIEQEESTPTRTQFIALELVARCWSGETIPPYRFFFLSFPFLYILLLADLRLHVDSMNNGSDIKWRCERFEASRCAMIFLVSSH